ncbi:MAG: hypothetical protein RIR79_760 [Pseudomonadota bacterium]|jgi:hypothetical protein
MNSSIFLGELFGVAFKKPIDKINITQLADILPELVKQIMEKDNKTNTEAADIINKSIMDFANTLEPTDTSDFLGLLETELSTRSIEPNTENIVIASSDDKWNFYIRFKVSEPLGLAHESLYILGKYVITADKNQSLKDSNILILNNTDSLIYREIAQESKKVEQALILAFAKIGIGIAYPKNLASEAMLEIIKEKAESKFLQENTELSESHYEIPLIHFSDKFGVVLFPEKSFPWDSEAREEKGPANIINFSETFKHHYDNLNSIHITDQRFKKVETATSILTTLIFDDSLINKIILSMTVIEVLSEKTLRPKTELDTLEYLARTLDGYDAIDQNTKSTLNQALKSIQFQSISKSCKNLVKDLLGGKDAKLFYTLYEYRSQLVHARSLKEDSDEMLKIYNDSYGLAQRLLNAYIDRLVKSCSA